MFHEWWFGVGAKCGFGALVIDLWLIDTSGPGAAAVAGFDAELSPEERARGARFRFQRDRERYLLIHGAVRRILGEVAGVAPGLLRFRANAFGKPELVEGDVPFNLSRSGDWGLLAVSRDGPVGVDLECRTEVPEAEAVA